MKGLFTKEYEGAFGAPRQNRAIERVIKCRQEFKNGEFTIDENGAARNCIGRPLDTEMREVLFHAVGEEVFSMEATEAAYDKYLDESIAEYKANQKPPTAEELYEMRAAFGPGAVVVDVLTGREIQL